MVSTSILCLSIEEKIMYLIVVPCFNEAKRWDHNYWDAMLKTPRTTWLFVDDGSTDNTALLLKELTTRPNADQLVLKRNSGKSEAVRAGMNSAFANKQPLLGIGFIDADGAFDAREVGTVLDKCDEILRHSENDALWTSRVRLAGRHIERSSTRHYVGRVLSTIFSFGVVAIPYDTQCGFKVFASSSVLWEVLRTKFRTRWLFELEMLTRWNHISGRPMTIWEEPLFSWKEIGESKIKFREALRIGREVVKIKVIQTKNKKS